MTGSRPAPTRATVTQGQQARLLEEADRLEEAIDWYQQAATTGDPAAYWSPATWTGVDAFFMTDYWPGDHLALRQAVDLLTRTGHLDQARDWLETLHHQTGRPYPLTEGARQLEEAGRTEEAAAWYRRAAEAGDDRSLDKAIELLEQTGRKGEVIDLARHAAERGNRDAVFRVAHLLAEAGRTEEALAWLEEYGDVGASVADLFVGYSPLTTATGPLLGEGRVEDAIARLRPHLDAGDQEAMDEMASLLAAADRLDEAGLRTLRVARGDRSMQQCQWADPRLGRTTFGGVAGLWLDSAVNRRAQELNRLIESS